MKHLVILFFLIPLSLLGQNNDSTTTKEKAFKIVPLITSTPLMGWGFGVTTSYLYKIDDSNASKSQLNVGGQYTTTNSYSVFAKNNLWFKDNDILSSTNFAFSSINNEFTDNIFGNVEYNIYSFLIAEIIMFRIANHIYLGVPLTYKKLEYKALNESGQEFLTNNGVINENTGGLGIAASYDSRKNKYYPSDAVFATLRINNNPDWLGAVNNYYSFVVDARYYIRGFSDQDVWAWQLFGQYSSQKTPDSGLPTLSGKSILRGYPSGQFKAKYQTGGQTEYRYTINNSRFRLVGFFGLANLSGGSYGVDGNSRQDNGWYTSEGLGLRYKLQQVTGVDIRLDFVHTSEQDLSFYLKLNQAF
ncbi:MAG: BamA/TamA family outer membrane protein [Reichenbachiella sp.]